MAEQSTQIVREAPEIEAYKLGLLQSAKALADQGLTIPPYMVAEMSGLQIKATELAEAGIGGYQPYLQEAGYTLGDAQTAFGATMEGALPFQQAASDAMQAGLDNLPGQVEAAQTGISDAITAGGAATTAAQGALDTAATGARTAAAGGQEALGTAAANIPGVIQDVSAGNTAANLAAAQAAGTAADTGRIDTMADQLATADEASRNLAANIGQTALQQAGATQKQ